MKLRKSQIMQYSQDLNGYDDMFQNNMLIEEEEDEKKNVRQASLLANAPGRDTLYQSIYHQTEF